MWYDGSLFPPVDNSMPDYSIRVVAVIQNDKFIIARRYLLNGSFYGMWFENVGADNERVYVTVEEWCLIPERNDV